MWISCIKTDLTSNWARAHVDSPPGGPNIHSIKWLQSQPPSRIAVADSDASRNASLTPWTESSPHLGMELASQSSEHVVGSRKPLSVRGQYHKRAHRFPFPTMDLANVMMLSDEWLHFQQVSHKCAREHFQLIVNLWVMTTLLFCNCFELVQVNGFPYSLDSTGLLFGRYVPAWSSTVATAERHKAATRS